VTKNIKQGIAAADEITYVFADIEKIAKQPDGSIIVAGRAYNADREDPDGDILDDAFAKKALGEWFTERGNIREMHQASAVGKGQEIDLTRAGAWLTSKIVDPLAVRKVEEKVYSAYSVGIKGARRVFDPNAKVGRIVDGRIIEVSLVDYPAQDVGKLVIAKAALPDGALTAETGAAVASADEVKSAIAPEVRKAAEISDEEKRDAVQRAVTAQRAGETYTGGPVCDTGPWIRRTFSDEGYVIVEGRDGTERINFTTGPDGAVTLGTSYPVREDWVPKGASAETTKAIGPDAIRAQILASNPSVSKDEIEALLATFDAIQTPSSRPGGTPAEGGAATATEDKTDAKVTDSAEIAASAAASQARPDSDAAAERAQLSATDLAGSLKALLPDATKAALPDVVKALLATEEIKHVFADAAKSVVGELIQSTVQAETKNLRADVEKLSRLPAPGGPVRGSARTFAINDALEHAETQKVATRDDAIRQVLETQAKSLDPQLAGAARAALRSLEPATT
jgi:hypothetical protein